MESERIQEHEGPWRRLTKHGVTKRDLNEVSFGKTWAQRLDERFGASNWRFDTTAYDDENIVRKAETMARFSIANEAFDNLLLGKGYKTDEGIDLTGKVERHPGEPEIGDILISLDSRF